MEDGKIKFFQEPEPKIATPKVVDINEYKRAKANRNIMAVDAALKKEAEALKFLKDHQTS